MSCAGHSTWVTRHDVGACNTARHAEGGDCGTRYMTHCSCGFGQGASCHEQADAIGRGHRANPTAPVISWESGPPLTAATITDQDLRDLFARHCECRPLDLKRGEGDHAAIHDCDTEILSAIRPFVSPEGSVRDLSTPHGRVNDGFAQPEGSMTTKNQTPAQRITNPVWIRQQITKLVAACEENITEDQELANKAPDDVRRARYLASVDCYQHCKQQLERILTGKTALEDLADTLIAQGVQP